ncbi:MAG TPA: GerMN domain-containing protein [Thermoanaerobaculia bacterium]|nr:GerMN domain-containing protein [Thermoanaerobaculia bacterium]
MGRRTAVILVIALALASCRTEEKPITSNLSVENKVAMRPVALFYESPAQLLVAEQRNVALPENPAAALPLVMRELLKGSANAGVPPLFPPDTTVRGAYLLPDGTAVVDLGGQTLTDGWPTGTHQELMAIHSVVQTVVSNFPDAKRVRVLLNGGTAETLGGHISLGRPFTPNAALVQR